MFSVQLYRVELCNGEAVCSLCSLIMLTFVMGRQCVLCEAGNELLQLKPTKKHFYYNLILQNFLYVSIQESPSSGIQLQNTSILVQIPDDRP